jgi:hypothetical protein
MRLKSQLQISLGVIPADAGIQPFQEFHDPRFRGGGGFFGVLQLTMETGH